MSHWTILARPWDVWTQNAAEMDNDYALLTAGRKSAPVDPTNTVWR